MPLLAGIFEFFNEKRKKQADLLFRFYFVRGYALRSVGKTKNVVNFL